MDRLKVGQVIEGTMTAFTANIRSLAVYVVVMAALSAGFEWWLGNTNLFDSLADSGLLTEWIGLWAGLAGLLTFVVMLVAQYLLWIALLRNHGVQRDFSLAQFVPFFGLTLLSWLGIAFGLVLLVIPGLLLMGRWAIAPAILLAEDKGVIESLGQSWDAVKGRTTAVLLTMLIVWIATAVLSSIVTGGAFLATGDAAMLNPFALFAGHFANQLGSALLMALALWLFLQLRPSGQLVAEVFS